MSDFWVERNDDTAEFEESTNSNYGGVAMNISWSSLQHILRTANLCHEHEYINRIGAGEDGITVFFENFD